MVIFAGMAIAFALMWIGVKLYGVPGGMIGFVVGIIVTGYVATGSGVDLGEGVGCNRYSSFARDC